MFSHLVLGGVLVVLNITVLNLQAGEKARTVRIPRGELATTIDHIALNWEIDVIYDPDLVIGLQSKYVEGVYLPSEALALMVEGTPLEVVQVSSEDYISYVIVGPNSKHSARKNRKETNPKNDLKMKPKKNDFLSKLLFVLLPLSFGASQGTAQENTSENEEIYVMSPFVVQAEQDTGYDANSTLAGTRLNTNLNNVAASISVATRDFLDDVGARNTQTLMTYTLGTEVAGSHGNFSGSGGRSWFDGDSINRNPNFIVRVRGLDIATITRDFFLSNIPWDSYNVDRVEVNRGANGLLFGNGSPSGIVNQSTIRGLLGKDSARIMGEFGSYGSKRFEIDINRSLLDNKLAVRVAAKASTEYFKQEEPYIRDERVFGTLTYKPFELTTIRANVESGRQRANKPEWRPPWDGYTWWWDVGQPSYNAITGQVTLHGSVSTLSARNEDGSPNSAVIGSAPGFWNNHPTLIFDNPNTPSGNIYGENRPLAVLQRGPNGDLLGLRFSEHYNRALHAGEVGASSYRKMMLTDPEIFDFYNHLLYGENKQESFRFKTFNVAIEQLLPNRKGGIEFVYDEQNMDHTFKNPFNWQAYNLTLDINEVLLDGSANPNFLRPLVASPSWGEAWVDDRSTYRATAFYDLDFRDITEGSKFGDILGKHTFTLNYSSYERYSSRIGGRNQLTGLDYYYANPAIAGRKLVHQGAREYDLMVYLGDRVTTPGAGHISAVGFNAELPDQRTIPVRFYNVETSQWQQLDSQVFRNQEFDKSTINNRGAVQSFREELDSKVAIVHSEFLHGAIVSTLGWREDEYKSFRAPTSTPDETGFFLDIAEVGNTPQLEVTESTFSWGLVARLPDSMRDGERFHGIDARLFYNTSETFQPTAQRLNIFGEPLESPSGNTKEYGLIVDALDGKLSFRLAKYESDTAGASVDLRGALHGLIRDGVAEAWLNIDSDNVGNEVNAQAFRDWYNSSDFNFLREAFDLAFIDPNDPDVGVTHLAYGGVVLQTTDVVSEGYEFEMTYNPLSNWRIALNYAQQEVITSNTARDALEVAQRIEPIIQGPAGQIFVDGQGETLEERSLGFFTRVRQQVARDGFSQPEVREHRLNLITNYTFLEGKLANFGIGGAIRYQGDSVIGSGYIRDTNLGDIPDLNRPHYGPSETNYDLWVSYQKELTNGIDWTLQLNVRNIGVGDELIPAETNPDGTISAWRIAPPMTWTLRSTFEF
ncbi:MAG: TonB-dependent receptor plug domain-containing protein [Opitutales bacterium]|nr:TonB-dependent receptor plug domain-containing protein [Opitutales bacterium]